METKLEFKQVFILVWKNVFYEFEGFKGLRIVREFPEYQRKLLRSNIDFARIFRHALKNHYFGHVENLSLFCVEFQIQIYSIHM